MNKQSDTRKRSVNWNGPLRSVLLAALLLPLFASAPMVGSHATAQAQPVLLQMAAQRPDADVSIIVQKANKGSNIEARVAQAGGVVTKDLSIINAFAARMSAHAAVELAMSKDVRWVSLDAATTESVAPCPAPCIDVANLQSAYPQATRANEVWNTLPYLQGQGVGVAVVDSGVNRTMDDLKSLSGSNRVVAQAAFNSNSNGPGDHYGHGTHIAGIIGGNGVTSNGAYIGIAPKVNLINVKVSDDEGSATASDVVAGLQWVLNNKTTYNIRVVNMSLNSSLAESFNTNPIDAACEILWFNGVVVVVSAGNNGTSTLFPPANDPFVITVGAADDRGTPSTSDDVVAPFSAAGTTTDGLAKPDLVAPGRFITSVLTRGGATLPQLHSEGLVRGFTGSGSYFKMSGTSMASPMVAGAAALLLQKEPYLTPDQVKYRLKATARPYAGAGAGAGFLDIYSAVNTLTTQNANTYTPASALLWTGGQPVVWGSVNWNSVNWNSVNWNSVNWNSVNWNSVNWNSDYWAP